MAKQIAISPAGLQAAGVTNIYSVSGCISKEFTDYINHWQHNGYWMFDDPDIIRQIASQANVDLNNSRFFYYEAFEKQYDEKTGEWIPFHPEASFATEVKIADEKELQGYDITSFSLQNNPECSPLSCNNLAEQIEVNEHCLLPSLKKAKELLETGAFNDSEPGPFRIFAVYTFSEKF